MDAYQDLEKRFHRLTNLEDAAGVLGWDQQVMMPNGAAAARGEQLAALRGVVHEELCAPAMEGLLARAEADAAKLDGWQAANLKEMRRRWVYAAALPADLVAEHVRAVTLCEPIWREAKPKNDFQMLLPSLTRVLTLTREIAAARAEKLGLSPYDALLDEYEPGARSARIDEIFDELARFLPGLVGDVLEHQAKKPAPLEPKGPFPRAKQEAVARKLATTVGFDFEHGRLDESSHPFTEGCREDSRITTRYREDDFLRSMLGTLHEAGHALYEQGRPVEWRNQPVGKARGMGLHESQSLLIEMQACRSREFISYLAPLLRDTYGDGEPAFSEENLARLTTRVSRGLIRVDADEVTYPLHVILRYRIERKLLAGELALADLPGAWSEGMRSLVGAAPPDDRHGCLQDVHWPSGAFAYFPTYTVGAMTAAQLFDAATRAEPQVRPGIARGDFAPLRAWLRENVHAQASRYTTDEVVTRATGRPLEPRVFRKHLETRYLAAS